MPNYDLYVELALDKDMPPTEMGTLLDGRINTLLGQGFQQSSPEVDQLSTARAILSDPFKRNTYEAALAGQDGVIDVAWLHALADATSAPVASPTPSAGYAAPYDATATTTLGTSPFSEPAYAPPVDGGIPAARQTPEQAYPQSYGQNIDQSYGHSPVQSYGQQSQAAFGAQNLGSQYNPENFVPVAPPTAAKPQFDAALLSVAGRDRSQSKVYLACVAIMVLGMIYPLILLFTADDTSFDIFKGILFAIAHTAAWIGIAEIIWGVRRIVAPAEPEENAQEVESKNSASSADSQSSQENPRFASFDQQKPY